MAPSFFRFRSACVAGATLLVGVLAPLAGCEEEEPVIIDNFAVTSVSVIPEIFLGSLTCGENGMKAYVATLSDVSAGDNSGNGFQLPSSAPASCFTEVRFERVTIGREYSARIDGYDRDDIVPLGCYPELSPGCAGSSVMVDAATGVYVAPKWTTSCAHHRTPPGVDAGPPPESPDAGLIPYLQCRGRAAPKGQAPWLDGPVCVMDLVTIPVRGCDPLTETSAAP
jgi:hypothetical protein